MTSSDRTPERVNYNQILAPWFSAGIALLALGATCVLAVGGYPAAAVAAATVGTAGGLSVTVIVTRRR